jgi:hypothetical protein
MPTKLLLVSLAAVSILAAPIAAFAQSTDANGRAMGSERVGNGKARMTTQGTVGAGTGMRANGTNHPTPSSTQGDVGPDGNNNGTLTPPAR